MDPLTHALLGGVAAQAASRRPIPRGVALAGALGAMAPDLDFLIQAGGNPVLFLEYHRHFTHSLLFIPIGGLLVGSLVWLLLRRGQPFWKIVFAATLGYATHGLLDACTCYGTMLLWPFSSRRFSWDFIAIIDPLYSLILLIGLWIAGRGRIPRAARIALLLSTLYLGFGAWQHHVGMEYQKQLAGERQEKWEGGRVMPTLGNIFLWRSLYRSGENFKIDALRYFPGGKVKIFPGGSLPVFLRSEIQPPPPAGSLLNREIEIFEWFAEGEVARLNSVPWQLGDIRYAALPNQVKPLWGIEFDPRNPEQHVRRLRFPFRPWENLPELWKMLVEPGGVEVK